MSGSYTLRQVQRDAQDLARVEELASTLGERIMGANWDWLGRVRPDETVDGKPISYRNGAWSWHRRQHGRAAGSPPAQGPLIEDSPIPDNDLVTVGLLPGKTGIPELKVYLQYYRIEALQNAFVAGTGAAPFQAWNDLVLSVPARVTGGDRSTSAAQVPSSDEYIYPEGQAMDLHDETKAIAVRVVVTWRSTSGGRQSHELVFARRK
jgi:hypothetical protein